jgi:type IV pilus assembly protein PilA
MKKQSGFTLIELLLVLAIIGIISAIAIPALLGQRSRARDKAATQNMTGTVADLIGAWDKARESGATAASCKTAMEAVLSAANARGDKNPWGTAGALTAYNATIGATSPAATALGQVIFGLTGSNMLVGKVLVKNPINGSTTVAKRSNLE